MISAYQAMEIAKHARVRVTERKELLKRVENTIIDAAKKGKCIADITGVEIEDVHYLQDYLIDLDYIILTSAKDEETGLHKFVIMWTSDFPPKKKKSTTK